MIPRSWATTSWRRDPAGARGVGIIEAPRGTLIHHYRVGDDDLVTMCNLIVSTTHNNQAMNEAIREVAREHLDGHEPTEALLNHIEVAIRAFDPCLSCATHAWARCRWRSRSSTPPGPRSRTWSATASGFERPGAGPGPGDRQPVARR
jgi:coenzyme F420-reducing hydrogenase alpha subunit